MKKARTAQSVSTREFCKPWAKKDVALAVFRKAQKRVVWIFAGG